MKFTFSVLIALLSIPLFAQQPPQKPQQPPQPQQPHGTVIFSRSAGDGSSTLENQPQPGDTLASGEALQAVLADEAKANPIRLAERITALALDLRLRPREQSMAVRAGLTLRNDGNTPLNELRLQISSTLHWDSARLLGSQGEREVKFTTAKIHSDADHTGLLTEITLPLTIPLTPGAATRLDLLYSGIVPQVADRLTAIGTPDAPAQHSDWDRISAEFSGLRGYGNVAWYPVAAQPVFLGEQAELFDALALHRRQNAGMDFSLQLTIEYAPGEGNLAAFVNGREVQLTFKDAHSNREVVGIAHGSLAPLKLGFDEPNLFVAQRTLHEAGKLRLWMKPRDQAAAKSLIDPWSIAVSDVTPFLGNWLGQQPDARLNLLELPETGDAPFESAALLAAPLDDDEQRDGAARIDGLEMALAHSLTHAWLIAGKGNYEARPLWLNEGLAWFMASLWIEKQHGHEAALRLLEAGRQSLALQEPESPGTGDGEPLAIAYRPVYTRTKAGYVFWMLRDLVGDGTLTTVLRAELKGDNAAAEEAGFEQVLRQAATGRDIDWFLSDWIDADKGLPDLSIKGVYPSAGSTPDSWIVAVDLANAGYAAAEVKLTVSSDAHSESTRVLVPARGKITPKVLLTGKPEQVQLNDGTVPETQATVHIKTIE